MNLVQINSKSCSKNRDRNYEMMCQVQYVVPHYQAYPSLKFWNRQHGLKTATRNYQNE